MNKYILAAAISSLSLGATAEINVDFETPQSYKAVSIWDNWEESPFRTGVLKGNFAVTSNPDPNTSEITGIIPNDSKTVLGAQRSRFGSNFFGARVDLPETFELTPTTKYVHVMLLKTATKGRVMLIGLGKRQERHDQSPETTQFRVMSNSAIEPGRWFDAVFAVKGAGGIDINSLVVVPDCESPHALDEDFLFYVDNIIVDDSPSPRINSEYYPVTGSKAASTETTGNGASRGTTGVYLVANNDTTLFAFDQRASKKIYTDLTAKTFYAKPGQTLTPGIKVNFDNWMHSYCYIDFGNDGSFNKTNELVSYDYYQGKNSKGETTSDRQQGTVGVMPSFTIPADTKPGMYRIRFKIDWDCDEPAGNSAEGNTIAANGGSVTDAMLCVYGDNVMVNDFQLNGEILAENGDRLNAYSVPADKSFAIKSAPEKGFHNGGVTLNFGYNLNDEPLDRYGNPQYVSTFVSLDNFDDNNVYTIPAEMMRGDLLINGNMVENGPVGPCEEAYFLNFPETLKMARDDRHLNSVTITTAEGTVEIVIPENGKKKIYHDFLSVEVPVKAGETVTPSLDYTGNAMHNYFYVDLDENGVFSTDLSDDGTPYGDLLSYSYYEGKNSKGEEITSKPGSISPNLCHKFVIPSDTPEGLYRCRVKIDWNYIEPGGHYGENDNDIDANGGAVLDFLFHVHSDVSKITSSHLATVNEQPLPFDAPRNQELLVAPVTTDGQVIKSITARYGYKLNSDSPTKYCHTYWRESDLGTDSNNAFVIPASIVDRPVHLIAAISDQDSMVELELIKSDSPVYNLQGRVVTKASRGIVISKDKKILR